MKPLNAYSPSLSTFASVRTRRVRYLALGLCLCPQIIPDGAWPPPDSMIWRWLVLAGISEDAKKVSRRFLCFFQAVFEETAKAIRQFESVGSQEEFALCWYKHLTWTREQLYQSVVNRAVSRYTYGVCSHPLTHYCPECTSVQSGIFRTRSTVILEYSDASLLIY